MKILLFLLLTGCAAPFTPSTFNNHINLTVVIDDNLPKNVAGMTKRKGSNCTIYVPTIRDLDDPKQMVYAKEIMHCIYGDYHKGIIDTL